MEKKMWDIGNMFVGGQMKWLYLILNIQSSYFLLWRGINGQKYGFFETCVGVRNTVRVGVLIRYESFFSYNRDTTAGDVIEFTVDGRYGLYYFFNNNSSAYISSAVPSVDMRRIYSKILANRRFLRISLQTRFLRSKKLTKLLQTIGFGIRVLGTSISIQDIMMFVFKVFTSRECSWFISSGLLRINNRTNINSGRCVQCGDIFNWMGGVFFFCHILYFRFNLNRWLWRKRRRTIKKLTKFVFYGEGAGDGEVGLSRMQKVVYTGDMYWGVECDYRLCMGVVFFNLQTRVTGLLNSKQYTLHDLNVWSFSH